MRRARRLSLESLENREMLNVDWGGFGAETTTEFQTGGADYSVELPSNVDFCGLVNLQGDSKAELVSIYGKGKTVSVYVSDGSGNFSLAKEQTISELGNWGLYSDVKFADFNNDGFDDMLVLSSSGTAMTSTVYTWNSSSSSFVKGSSASLDVSPFAASSRYVFTEFSSALLENASGGYDLALQVSTLTTSAQTTALALYSGVATSSFGSSPSVKSGVTGTLLGSTVVNGDSYLLLKEATASANYLALSKFSGNTVQQTRYDFTGYGSKFVFNWVAENDGFLVVGSVLGGSAQSGLATLNLKEAPEDGATVDATTLGQWIACDSISLNSSSVGTLGDAAGDADLELFIANGEENASVFYLGDASIAYGYVFTEASLVVSSPKYHSVYVGDYDNDGKTEALLVGDNYIYVADVAANGSLTNQTELYKFSQPAAKAVFGDFDGDGAIDVAVQYKANVGSSLQIFHQIAGGDLVALTTQTIPGTFVDLTVGKFSQTSVDEIAVVYTAYKNSTTATSANVYKLDTTKNSLTASYSCTYIGVGSAVAAGDLYGTGRDDLVVVSESSDSVQILRNSGSALVASNLTTRYSGTDPCRPTSAVVADLNGDGLNDLAVMNSSAGSNTAEVVYYLRSAANGLGTKPTGRVAVNGTITAVDNTSIVGELQSADLNADGYADLVFVRKATAGTAYLGVLMGNGTSSVFDALINTTVSCDPANSMGVALARVDSGNVSQDFVWVQDKTFAVLLNSDSTSASGGVRYVLRSASSAAGTSLSASVAAERTWLDEWSNFYVEVWATTEGAVSSVGGSFSFNPDYFSFSAAENAPGFTVDASDSNGSVAFTATGSGTADSDGWVLVSRLRFEPVANGGLALNDSGTLYAVDPGFSASASAQAINGTMVETATVPTGVEVYPFAFDLNDNGQVDLEDFTLYTKYYEGKSVNNISTVKHRVLDVNGNSLYDLEDFTLALQSFNKKAAGGYDSAYQTKPVVSSASSAVLDAALTAVLLDSDETDSLFVEEDVDAIAEDLVVDVPARTVEQRLSVRETSSAVFCGPMPKPAARKFDLKLDLTTEL
ncbi:MAG: VCBS repeat-containing protein [Thermoguttaceae bacterium]|nr:VCBS repeat-containing protein [Thermoguttaceae bacterium]